MNTPLTSIRGSRLDKKSFVRRLGLDYRTVQAATCVLPALEERALQRLENSPFPKEGVYVGHSGGKDSVVIAHLARKIFGNLPIVHTPKDEGPNKVHALTRDFLYNLDEPILYVPAPCHAQLSFKTQIDGTRLAEATRTDGRSTTFVSKGEVFPREQLTEYVEDGLFGLNFIFPIIDWSDAEVWAYILDRDLPFSREYLP